MFQVDSLLFVGSPKKSYNSKIMLEYFFQNKDNFKYWESGRRLKKKKTEKNSSIDFSFKTHHGVRRSLMYSSLCVCTHEW